MKIIASFPICYLPRAPISWEYLTGGNVECLLPSLLEQTLVKSRDCADSEAWHLTVCVWLQHLSQFPPGGCGNGHGAPTLWSGVFLVIHHVL